MKAFGRLGLSRPTAATPSSSSAAAFFRFALWLLFIFARLAFCLQSEDDDAIATTTAAAAAAATTTSVAANDDPLERKCDSYRRKLEAYKSDSAAAKGKERGKEDVRTDGKYLQYGEEGARK